MGDIATMKRTIDEEIVKIVEKELGYPEDHYWSNVKLLIMLAAVAIALVGQFYPVDPRTGDAQSRMIVTACVVGYFALSAALQFVITFVDGNTIMITNEPSALRVRTDMPAYDKMFEIKISSRYAKAEDEKHVAALKVSVEKLFNEDGELQRIALEKVVKSIFAEAKKMK